MLAQFINGTLEKNVTLLLLVTSSCMVTGGACAYFLPSDSIGQLEEGLIKNDDHDGEDGGGSSSHNSEVNYNQIRRNSSKNLDDGSKNDNMARGNKISFNPLSISKGKTKFQPLSKTEK